MKKVLIFGIPVVIGAVAGIVTYCIKKKQNT